jgi:hypothetical protein
LFSFVSRQTNLADDYITLCCSCWPIPILFLTFSSKN